MQRSRRVSGQLEGVTERIRKLEQDLQKERNENARLQQRLARKDQRIGELLEEKFGLADQLHQKMMGEVQPGSNEKRKASQGGQEEAAASTSQPGLQNQPELRDQSEPQNRRPGCGFTRNPLFEEDDGGAAADIPDLSEWYAKRRPSKVKPQVLSDAPWMLSEVSEEERTEWKRLREQPVNVKADGDKRPTKRRRLDSEDLSLNGRRDSVTFGREVTNRDREERGRGLHSNDRGFDRQPAPMPPSVTRRKAVCVSCWSTGRTCNLSPRCHSCAGAGTRCVWKFCEGRDTCRIWRCPCLHPGEWDERDSRYVVEEGRMPRKY